MSPNVVTVLRWVARIAGVLVLSIVLMIAVGEGYPSPFTYKFTPSEAAQSLSLLAMLVGIVLTWKWEGWGGALITLGYGAFLTVESLARHTFAVFSASFSFLNSFLLLGLLNLIVWWLSRRSHQTD